MVTNDSAAHKPASMWALLRASRGDVARDQERRGSGRKRMMALVLVLVMPLVALIGVFGAAAAHANDDDAMKYSFYKIASSTTAFFSTIQEPGSGETFSESWMGLISDPGSAGSLLGYADPDYSSVSGWLASKLSGSSDAIGYDTLLVREPGDTSSFASSAFQGMADYAYFGATLQGMGLDGTSTGLSPDFLNWIGGGIVMLLFVLGGAVDFIFNAIVSMLSLLNPFKLFWLGLSSINPELADGMVGNGNPDVGPLSGVVSFIGGWFQVLNGLAWGVMVPIFIAVLAFSLVLFKKLDRGSAVKKFIVRLMFIGLGLPLLGSMYTGMIDSMADASSSGNTGSARVVLSTYVDFEKWATNSRLAIPDGAVIEWDTRAGQPSGAAQAGVRNTALAINNQTLGLNLNPIISADSFDASWANQIMEGKEVDARTSAATFSTTVDLLGRFMTGAQVSAASFETITKGDLSQSRFFAEHRGDDTVKGWFEGLTKDAAALNEENPRVNPIVAVRPGSGLRAESAGSGVRAFSSSTAGCTFTGTTIVSGGDGGPRACNLSPLAMYNFLNTDFGSTSMQMYSSSNVASEATRSIHNSVNQVGTGTMSLLYWMNAVTLLGAFVLIGFGYAFALLFANIRRSFQIITAVPFAQIGALAAIAKVIIYSLALILEVLVTIFVYMIVQEFLTSLPQLIEMPFAAILRDGAGGPLAGFVSFLVSGWGFSLVITLCSMIGVIGFTVLALRVRKSFVKAVEEAVTKLVEKFVGASAGLPGNGGGLLPQLAGGAASGAGAVAASQMMNRSGGKGPVAAGLPSGGHGGPDGISTAGGFGPAGSGPAGEGGDGQLRITGPVAGAPGNGDPGTPVAGLPGGTNDATLVAQEVALGRQVEANGLTRPEEIRGARADEDTLGTVSNSLEASAAGYRAADTKRLEAGKSAAEAAGHSAIAAGRAVAGDEAGAVRSGARAVQSGASAAAAGQQAKRMEAGASRSALDKPSPKGVRAEAAAGQISRAGGVAAAATSKPSGATVARTTPATAAAPAGPRGGAGGAQQFSAPGAAPRPPKPVTPPRPADGVQKNTVPPAQGRVAPAAPRPAHPAPAAPPVRSTGQVEKRPPQSPRRPVVRSDGNND